MWTYIELSSAAEHEARLGVIWSLATPGVFIRGAAPHRRAAPIAAATDHRSHGRLTGSVRWPWSVVRNYWPRIGARQTATDGTRALAAAHPRP